MASKSNSLSPIMQQYLDMKSENPSSVLLFRLGDFYECFFGDAVIVSRALDLVLTRRGLDDRGVDIPMCGIPWHASDNYLARLVKAGIPVAIAEQMETPEEAKIRGHKQIERKIIRVLTSGTLTDDNLLSPTKSNYLIAVSGENIACADISTGELIIGQGGFDDISRLNPAEVIYSEELAETQEIKRLREIFNTTAVGRRIYDRSDIEEIKEKILGQTAEDKWGASAFCHMSSALNLLAGYLHNTQRGAKLVFRTPKRLGAGARLLIDFATWKSLEIDEPILAGGACLLDVIERTKTAAGARKLKSCLRELSGDISEIQTRQTAIGHLLSNRDVADNLRTLLSAVPDVGRAIGRLQSGRGMPRDLQGVANFISSLPLFKVHGARLDESLSARFAKLPTFDEFADELSRALNENLPAFFRDGGIIKDGFDAALDNIRSLAHGAKETIAGLQSSYIASSGVSSLKIKYNNILGYHIEVPAAKADNLFAAPDNYIHRQTMAGNVRFTTARLIELDNDVRGAAEKSAAVETEIVMRLIESVKEIAADLLNAADLLADVDFITALADVALECNWTRPAVVSEPAFNVIGGRHPVVEHILRKKSERFIKNDCRLDKKIALLTGPNMAGKSTYLRQNALIVVLAHLGSFVPAESATIGICDQLFSRVGASDNLAAGQSTFMVEMSETANILNRATARSFIIFDEIGRGTATYDGLSIAHAILEFLDKMQPRTLFATHYHELTRLALKNVQLLTIDVREFNNEIIFMHRIVSGAANRSYGIHVAQMAGMPASVVRRAEEILAELEGRHAENKRQNPQLTLF